MLSEFFLKIPYFLFFIPLIGSILMNFIDDKRFIKNFVIIILSILIFLVLIMFFNVGVGDNFFVNNNKEFNIIGTEFRINQVNIIFFIIILFLNIVSFFNYYDKVLFNRDIEYKDIKYLFSVYLIYLFSIVGILFTYNIYSLFIFLEIYSFCIYTIISMYKSENLNIVTYKYYSNNITGSLLMILSIFYLSVYFNTNNLMVIKQQLITVDLQSNLQLAGVLLIFICSLIVKFFVTGFNLLHDTNTVKTNFLSFSNLFSDIFIGIYLIFGLLFFLVDVKKMYDFYYFGNIISILCYIFLCLSSYALIKKKFNKNVFSFVYYSNISSVSYIILSLFLNSSSFLNSLTFLFCIDFLTINLGLYLFSLLLTSIYGDNKFENIYKNENIKILFFILLIFKIFFPIGISMKLNFNLIKTVLNDKNILLGILFLFNKYYLCSFLYRFIKDAKKFKEISINLCLKKNEKVLILSIIYLILFNLLSLLMF